MKRHPFRANGSEFADSVFSNIAATFHQCLSQIVSKLSTWDNLGKASRKNISRNWQKPLANLLVPSALHWWVGVGNIDRLLTVSLVVEKLQTLDRN